VGTGSLTAVPGTLLLALLAACTAPQTSEPESRTGGPAPSRPNDSAICRVTPGQPPQDFGFAAANASHVQLGPGMEVATSAESLAAARRGKPLRVFGQVLAADCATPIPRAKIQVWQTNGDGDYGPAGNNGQLHCCFLTATLTTDASGRYEILTVMPGHYRHAQPPPPAHIHFDVRSPTGPGVMTELEFAGDPALSGPTSADDEPRAIVSLHRVPRADPPLQARFDIVLGRP